MTDLRRGTVVWVDLDPTRGREQRGTRPALVISSGGYLQSVPELVVVVPLTTVDRAWRHHPQVGGPRLRLARPSCAMTEQPRTIARERITGTAGQVDERTMAEVDVWLRDFLGLASSG